MDQAIKVSKKSESKEGAWFSLVSNVITTSMGGAVIGGSLASLPGAGIGGAVGAAVAFWSQSDSKKHKSAKKSAKVHG